jgi:hypothetical protein
MFIYGGELALRVLGGVNFMGSFEFLSLSFSCSVFFSFELFLLFFAILLGLPSFMPFVGLALFPLLDDLLELFLAFWSSSCASWGFRFELQTLCLLSSMDSSRGRLRNQMVSSLI